MYGTEGNRGAGSDQNPKEVAQGEGCRLKPAALCAALVRTKGISDVFIDRCPSRKCPFIWTMESGKGKQVSMGGSHTSSTLGNQPAIKDRAPTHCAS